MAATKSKRRPTRGKASGATRRTPAQATELVTGPPMEVTPLPDSLRGLSYSYESALPFSVHLSGDVDTGHGSGRLGSWVWSEDECWVANEALHRGFLLAVLCPPECVARATAELLQAGQ